MVLGDASKQGCTNLQFDCRFVQPLLQNQRRRLCQLETPGAHPGLTRTVVPTPASVVVIRMFLQNRPENRWPIIPPRAVIVQTGAGLDPLTGVAIERHLPAGVIARAAVSIVAQLRQPCAAAVGSDGRRGQVVVEQVERVAAGAHRDPDGSGVVVLAHGRAVVALVGVADVNGRGAVNRVLNRLFAYDRPWLLLLS